MLRLGRRVGKGEQFVWNFFLRNGKGKRRPLACGKLHSLCQREKASGKVGAISRSHKGVFGSCVDGARLVSQSQAIEGQVERMQRAVAWLNRAFVWFSASTYLCLTRRALLHARLHQMSQAREKRSISAFLQSLARGAFCMCRAWTDRYVNQTKLCSCMWRAWPRTRAGSQTPPKAPFV